MRRPSRQTWRKLTLFGVAASVAVMAMGSDEDTVPAKSGHGQMRKISAASSRPMGTAKPYMTTQRVEFERLLQQRRQPNSKKKVGNVFNTLSWYEPPPPPPPLPPQEPSAPPLPFTYLGQYKGTGTSATVIILANADRVYTVSEGDVIDGTYSVGAITSGQLELTYLPLKIKQTLNTGEVL